MSELKKTTKPKKQKERWLLTRKTWKYMTDAGRKLIPDHLSGHKAEDVKKIEQCFQETCSKEPKFVLWRKNSYPGNSQKKTLKKCGGSVRILSKTNWDKSNPVYVSGGRFDHNKFKNELTILKNRQDLITEYLKVRHSDHVEDNELVEKIERYLNTYKQYSNIISVDDQASLIEILNRYFKTSSNRQKIISDLLTDRRLLEHLYFNLRKTRNFQSRVKNQIWLRDPREELICLPEIAVNLDTNEKRTQTDRLSNIEIMKLQKIYQKNSLKSKDNENKSSHILENDDVSQSVSETIMRYLKMARKKSIDNDKKNTNFKTINYDHTLRDIHGAFSNKETQTDPDWMFNTNYLNNIDPDLNNSDSEISTTSYESNAFCQKSHSTPSSPPNSSFSNFLQRINPYSNTKSCYLNETTNLNMKKSKSSSNLVTNSAIAINQYKSTGRKFFRNRSKSQTRIPIIQSFWIPQSSCTWYNGITGKSITLKNKKLTNLNDEERKTLQKISLSKIQSINLNVPIKIPNDEHAIKTKRRSYLMKKKSLSDCHKDSTGLVFGVSLNQCIENDRLLKTSRTDSLNSEENITTLNKSSTTLKSEGNSNFEYTDSLEVPLLLLTCIKHLKTDGLHTVGIFRVSSSKKRVKQLRDAFDIGKDIDWNSEQSPHDIATLLKEYLRDLPDPLLCRDLYQAFLNTQKIRNRKQQLDVIQYLIQLLPSSNVNTLYMLLTFLSEIAENSEDQYTDSGELLLGNKMDTYNLATVFAPNILHNHKNGQQNITNEKAEERNSIINIIKLMIDHCNELFEISADLLDEIYLEMMETNPQALNDLMKETELYKSDISIQTFDSSMPLSILSEDVVQSNMEKNTEKMKPAKKSPAQDECIGSGFNSIFSRIREVSKDLNSSTRSKLLKIRSASIDGSTKTDNESVFQINLMADSNVNLMQNRRQSCTPKINENIPFVENNKQINILTPISQVHSDKIPSIEYIDTIENIVPKRDYNASISNIGNAVMKSRTSDFEQITKNNNLMTIECQSDQKSINKKVYNRRKYTDHRHPTTEIPEIRNDNINKPITNLFKRQEIIASSPRK